MNPIRHITLRYRLVLLLTLSGFAALPGRLAAGLPQCDNACFGGGFYYCCGVCDYHCVGPACTYSCSTCC